MPLSNPNQLKWNTGQPPDVKTVPKDCSILIWIVHEGKIAILTVRPWQNIHNPLIWADQDGYPLIFKERVAYWAWLDYGTDPNENWHTNGF